MHVPHMLKISRVYTLPEILIKIFEKNNNKTTTMNFEDLFTIMFDKLTIKCQPIFFI